ncbi:uncharacterized protein sync [Notolabrus celidotus]|uniref:uncharacterized protein sync n=1 Tax=Notolabrus celidotus TaxID=1203425 RepID=UPI00148F5ECB|nr:uncharacterized protein sync [Notolabrus celidotus]
MEDMEDSSSTGFEPLFIKEEDPDPNRTFMEQNECHPAQSGFSFTRTQLNPSTVIKPYLQEMDELLRNCQELTGIPFGSKFSASYDETNLTETTQCHRKEVTMDSYEETSVSPHAYLSTSYIDTQMDGVGDEDQPAQGQAQGLDQIINRCGVTTDICHQKEMPLTSAGNKLSDSMVEYEGQLVGMLAMLESCMEETGMDFEPQDWATDGTQEYVHISTKSNLRRGTTLVPIRQERLTKLETHPLKFESCVSPHDERNAVCRESRNEVTFGSAPIGSQPGPVLSFDNTDGFSMERFEGQENSKGAQGGIDGQFRFSGPSLPLDSPQDDPMCCEETKTGCMFTNEDTFTKGDMTGIEVNSECPADDTQELGMDSNNLESGMNELSAVGSQMEECIQEVQQLKLRRKELLAEVLKLRGDKDTEELKEGNEEGEETEEQIDCKVAELMNAIRMEEEGRGEERKKEIQGLRVERADEEKRIWTVNLERQGLHGELRKLKRRLFAIARECAHSQVALNTQRREMELLKRDEENMKSLVLQLTEERTKLRGDQQEQLLGLQAELYAQGTSLPSNTKDEMTQCKRHSCGDIQQFLQGGLKALESRYEPIMLALLKRREITAEALVKAKDQAQVLKTQLTPLMEEIQKLHLQRTCLEEKIRLCCMQRREDVGQYKERVNTLEERSRELKTELKIQKRKIKEIEELKDTLNKHLQLYRQAIEDHQCDDEQKQSDG